MFRIIFLFTLIFCTIGCSKKETTLQEFVNFDPQYKQISHVQEKLNIKPIKIDDGLKGGKSVFFIIENCEIIIGTDKNQNISTINFSINSKCPFRYEGNGLVFDSKKSTLKKIFDDLNDCYGVEFASECIGSCGNAYDPTDLNYLEISGSRMCNFATYTFVFDENKGIKSWKDQIIKDSGESTLLKSDISKDQGYNNAARKLWDDKLPAYFEIK